MLLVTSDMVSLATNKLCVGGEINMEEGEATMCCELIKMISILQTVFIWISLYLNKAFVSHYVTKYLVI